MEKFIVGLADDEDIIHNMIDTFVATLNTDSIKVEHFYFNDCYEDLCNPNNLIFASRIKDLASSYKKGIIGIEQLDNYIKNETILIKREISIKLPDAIILATAKINNLILLTQDEGILKYNGYKNIQIKKCF